ncbi:response regulator [Frigoriglobus tundricola]|uniref:Two-component transcriptional response regulator, LuxR family n=1 Tax=Frigoriglobus tundricola TaxID=2774151 RepID=A0A6M5YZB8_9BACT|nr:response regulator [Frigoriglobus tundricola]QJW98262.1 Two-component transcriptional response regulator, LuxR family [Frigoriglobus tundricola]
MLKPILLVEDNPKDLELTLLALAKSNLANEVVTVRDGEECLDYLFMRGPHAGRAKGHPAVVLLDLKLPKVDGLQVLEELKKDATLQGVPVVMLTTSREEQDLLRSYKLGVNAYVVKPVAFKDFMQAIQDLGVFWAVINEPPPGSLKPGRPAPSE